MAVEADQLRLNLLGNDLAILRALTAALRSMTIIAGHLQSHDDVVVALDEFGSLLSVAVEQLNITVQGE